MPDENNPAANIGDQTTTPSPATQDRPAPSGQTPQAQPKTPSAPPTTPQEPTGPPPPIDTGAADIPPLPPPAAGAPWSEGAPPTPETPGEPGGGDIPPVISTSGKPKKKFGGKKVIATILGILFLVGGIGAGVILVQRQQDIRERAKVIGECQNDTDCPSGYYCETGGPITYCEIKSTPAPTAPPPECFFDDDCRVGEECIRGECSPLPPPPTPAPQPTATPVGAAQCTRVGLISSDVNAASITVTQAMLNECKNNCSDGRLWVASYECDGVNLSGGCQDNGKVESDNASVGQTFSVSSPSCGSIQIDVGCKNDSGTWGSVAFVSKSAAEACSTPAPPPSGISAQCLNIQAFDTDWNKLAASDLASLNPGDKVRFTVSGTTTSGSINKARFIINGVTRPEVIQKRPGTQEFYDEYTIPEGLTSFTIKSQLNHSSIGWF